MLARTHSTKTHKCGDITQRDVQSAADEFRPLYDRTDGKDGYVSLEVNPHLAHDTNGTLQEARRLWGALNRPNVFIKVPATVEGLPAIRQLIGEGINVNVTLLFGLPRYRQVAEAYIAGIEARSSQGKAVKHVASVASFFVSRMDALVDPLLQPIVAQGGRTADVAKEALGQVALASAKMAYQIYKEIFGSDRFKSLAAQGARVQRLLWASTGAKNPDHSDVKYVEALIGPDTVNTAPVETLDAYRDHGDPQARLENNIADAARILKRLPELGINIDKVTQQLEDEGVAKFNKPFDKLMETLAQMSPLILPGKRQTPPTRRLLQKKRIPPCCIRSSGGASSPSEPQTKNAHGPPKESYLPWPRIKRRFPSGQQIPFCATFLPPTAPRCR
jgi:transaldolase